MQLIPLTPVIQVMQPILLSSKDSKKRLLSVNIYITQARASVFIAIWWLPILSRSYFFSPIGSKDIGISSPTTKHPLTKNRVIRTTVLARRTQIRAKQVTLCLLSFAARWEGPLHTESQRAAREFLSFLIISTVISHIFHLPSKVWEQDDGWLTSLTTSGASVSSSEWFQFRVVFLEVERLWWVDLLWPLIEWFALTAY